ncbi:hypothetical protein [Bradyrhizobium sp. B120]|uniref:hypothetical protein n=1 Tax=Bradyrhizobium sp. B120 TaxID=3410088 RepID=UPI003B98656B
MTKRGSRSAKLFAAICDCPALAGEVDAPEFSKFVADDSARLIAAVKKIGKDREPRFIGLHILLSARTILGRIHLPFLKQVAARNHARG